MKWYKGSGALMMFAGGVLAYEAAAVIGSWVVPPVACLVFGVCP